MSWRHRTFDALPALSVRRGDLKASLRTITVAWMFGVVWMALISGSAMTTFGRLLGFSNYDFGVLAAIPWAAVFAQAFAAVFIERSGLRKYPFIYYASVNRVLWLAIAAVPLLLQPGRMAITAFFVIFGIHCVLVHLSIPHWQIWMGDLIPRRIRGRYFATRALWTIPIQIVVVAIAGILLDMSTTPGTPMTQSQPTLLRTICVLFAVAGVFGTIDALLFLRIREIVSPPLVSDPSSRRRRNVLINIFMAPIESVGVILESFRDRVFRHYALYGAVVTFSMTVCAQFVWLNALENLGYSKLSANLVMIASGSLAGLVVVRFWGRLVDIWGRRPILIIATGGAVLSPVFWLLIPPGNLVLAHVLGVGACIVGGATWMGVSLAQTGIILGFSETGGRSKHVASAAVIAAAGGVLGGLTGGFIAGSLEAFEPMRLGPFVWGNYHATFLVAVIVRAVSIFWLIGMPDPGSKPLRDVARYIRFNAYNNVMTRLFWPMRALGRIGKRNTRNRRNQDKP